jgi:hypothetical protein
MTTRIIFNGQEYEGPEAMPPDVRKAYQEMLDQFQDKDKDGVPDILQGRTAGKNVLGMLQTSVSFNGRSLEDIGGLPAPVRRLMGNVIAHEIFKGTAPTEPHDNEPLLRTLDRASRATEGLLWVLLAFLAGFVLILSVGLMFAIGGGSELLMGRLAIATAALFLLGWIDTHATRLARRRQPLLAPDTAGYRRFAVWSSVGFFLAAVLLFGLAWFLP